MTQPRINWPFVLKCPDEIWCNWAQWRRQLWGTGARAPLDFQQFYFQFTLE